MAILGLPSLRRKLRAMPDMARAEIMLAMEAGAEEVCAMARNLAPVDDGDLRDSIGWTWGDPPRGAIVIAKSRPLKNGGDMRLTVYAGDDRAFYARWVEFGTQAHSLAKGADASSRRRKSLPGRQHPGAKATPFFFPSYRANRKRMKSRVSRAITKAAKKVAAGK